MAMNSAQEPLLADTMGSGDLASLGSYLEDTHSLTEEQMVQVEAARCEAHAQELRELHPNDASVREEPIAIALSGGGTRAAAFHCGVLWALADGGLMKDVMHMCAISGGGYTAASLMTHIYQMSAEAESAPSLDAWYQRVVARTVLRMQENIGYLINMTPRGLLRLRDQTLPEQAGSGVFPHICDLPLMIISLVCSMMVSPMMLITHTVWPLVVAIDLYHSSALLSAWCDPRNAPDSSPILKAWIESRLTWTASLAVGVVIFHLLMRVCEDRVRAPMRYLVTRSLRQLVIRVTLFFAVYSLLIWCVLTLQVVDWGSAGDFTNTTQQTWVRGLCNRYVTEGRATACLDRNDWVTSYVADSYHNTSLVPPDWDADLPDDRQLSKSIFLIIVEKAYESLGLSGLVLVGVGSISVGSTLAKWFFTLLVPFCWLVLIADVARWKIFGPVTGQKLMGFGGTGYTEELSAWLLYGSVVVALMTLPFQDVLQKFPHLYYRRSLRQAYFHSGEDVSCAAIATCSYCPNMLLGACLHDYRRPAEDLENFCDFTISTFFLGCSRTGYFYTRSQERLAHLMTTTGAATDAWLLTTSDALLARVLLAIMSLRFGDFIRLQGDGLTAVRVSQRMRSVAKRVGSVMKGRRRIGRCLSTVQDHDQSWLQRWLQGAIDRAPAAFPFIICYFLLIAGTLVDNCEVGWYLLSLAYAILLLTLVLSFFAYIRPLRWLVRSPMMRIFQMVTMQRYKAPTPPPYVYLSDGGLIEVLGLLPLLRRRLKRIVVSDAGHDPELSMRGLRDVAAFARQERLCSFFDPRDPTRDLMYVLRDLAASDEGFLRLGIRYEARDSDGSQQSPEMGQLFYVRMRLPHDDTAPARSLLTLTELMETPKPNSTSPLPSGVLRKQLGGVCCECGGGVPNEQFPNFSMGNQFLTQRHFANLCSLGGELSLPLVRALHECKGSVA